LLAYIDTVRSKWVFLGFWPSNGVCLAQLAFGLRFQGTCSVYWRFPGGHGSLGSESQSRQREMEGPVTQRRSGRNESKRSRKVCIFTVMGLQIKVAYLFLSLEYDLSILPKNERMSSVVGES
jgi:hypothetical protein